MKSVLHRREPSQFALGGCVLVCALLALGLPLRHGNASEEGLQTLDALVGRWTDVRAAIAEESRQWEAWQRHWTQEIELLEQEDRRLRYDIETLQDAEADQAASRARAVADQAALEAETERLWTVVSRTATQLRSFSSRIPDVLLPASEFAVVMADAADDGRSLARQAQRLVGLLAQIEALHAAVHPVREMLDAGDGQRRQMDVIYIGLSRGLAVSADNDWAAVGHPTATGWRWTASPSDAAAIRQAVEILNRRQTARMVSLPMQMAPGENP